MTVEQLIEKLNKIEDKSIKVTLLLKDVPNDSTGCHHVNGEFDDWHNEGDIGLFLVSVYPTNETELTIEGQCQLPLGINDWLGYKKSDPCYIKGDATPKYKPRDNYL